MSALYDKPDDFDDSDVDWSQSESRAVGRVPRSLALALDVVPVALRRGRLFIGCGSLSDRVLDQVRKQTNLIIVPRQMSVTDIKSRISKIYPRDSEISDIAGFDEGPVKQKVLDLITDAVKLDAADILFTPQQGKGEIALKIDGAMTDHPYHTTSSGNDRYKHVTPSELSQMIRLCLTDAAMVDPTNIRIGHSGAAKYTINNTEVEIRWEAIPTNHGLSLVGRFMGNHTRIRTPEETGMSLSMRKRFERLMRLPDKLTIFTGPIGHGKTSSLYTWLMAVHDSTKMYRSAEQPIEVDLPFVAQTPIIEDGPMDFADCGRRFVRTSTDVICFGEFRDEPTVASGIRSAFIGHQVLATLHGSNVIEAIMRLELMGSNARQIALALRAILCQRIAFRTCQACSVDVDVPEYLTEYVESYTRRFGKAPTMRKPTGIVPNEDGRGSRDCENCGGRGFVGRIGIFELLSVNESVEQAIINRELPSEIVKRDPLYRPMIEDAIDKIFAGRTTEEFVRRVLPWTIEAEATLPEGMDEVE
jgi:general secretion pathway protein E